MGAKLGIRENVLEAVHRMNLGQRCVLSSLVLFCRQMGNFMKLLYNLLKQWPTRLRRKNSNNQCGKTSRTAGELRRRFKDGFLGFLQSM